VEGAGVEWTVVGRTELVMGGSHVARRAPAGAIAAAAGGTEPVSGRWAVLQLVGLLKKSGYDMVGCN